MCCVQVPLNNQRISDRPTISPSLSTKVCLPSSRGPLLLCDELPVFIYNDRVERWRKLRWEEGYQAAKLTRQDTALQRCTTPAADPGTQGSSLKTHSEPHTQMYTYHAHTCLSVCTSLFSVFPAIILHSPTFLNIDYLVIVVYVSELSLFRKCYQD